jgi:hypothetical protein
MKRSHLGALLLLASTLASTSTLAQQMPSHGAAAAGMSPTIVEPAKSPGYSYYDFKNDIGLEVVWIPSPGDDRFKDALGFAANMTVPLQQTIATRFGAGFETYNGDDGIEDADVVPLTLSFLFGPPSDGPISIGLELGLRYNLVDYEDAGGKYDDAFGGIVGAQFATDASAGFGVELGVGYRFDIVTSENDAGDELELDGLSLRFGLRFSL